MHNAKTTPTVYISCGDINGIGLELILRNHDRVCSWCNPIYCVHESVLEEAEKLLDIRPKTNIFTVPPPTGAIKITPGLATVDSGRYSFESFRLATELSFNNTLPLITLPINKYAWNLAGIDYVGHTHYLSHRFNTQAIMMLGCTDMLVALYTDHIPLREVSLSIQKEPLGIFFRNLHASLKKLHLLDSQTKKPHQALVLGLNPHAGEEGVLGEEDFVIKDCIEEVNALLGYEFFLGPVSPDSAFIPSNRMLYKIFVCMYHDIGLCALKSLYFDRSINVSLNLPILRVSVDHGTGFDRAYLKNLPISSKSYLECFKFVLWQRGEGNEGL